jgi:hypothetical protein
LAANHSSVERFPRFTSRRAVHVLAAHPHHVSAALAGVSTIQYNFE